ncbi:MAG: hypothetical protein HY666_01830 [Chloroflexi bacterium]|nr:hypothetical protein [Chloroflexota bacterium]
MPPIPRSTLIVALSLLVLLLFPLSSLRAQGVYPGSGSAYVTDDRTRSDSITIKMTGVALPKEGTSYEGWLVSDDEKVKTSLKIIQVGSDGVVNHRFTSPRGENLIHLYDKVLITIEPVPDPDPAPSELVAFKGQIPGGAMTHIRHLLTNWPAGSSRGILTNLKLQLETALAKANLARDSTSIAELRKYLEQAVNVIEGQGGANYGDLDGNGTIENPGDGVGVLNHAADRKHAGFASAAAPEDETIFLHARHVEDSGNNAEQWAISARDKALVAIKQSDVNNAKLLALGTVQNLTASLNGLDANGNGTIEPILGEGGAKTAYEHAQLMATYSLVGVPITLPKTGGFAPTPIMGALAGVLGLGLVLAGSLLLRRQVKAQRAN